MADMPTEHGAGSDDRVVNPDIHHEESDVNIRGIFAFAGALIVVAVVVTSVLRCARAEARTYVPYRGQTLLRRRSLLNSV